MDRIAVGRLNASIRVAPLYFRHCLPLAHSAGNREVHRVARRVLASAGGCQPLPYKCVLVRLRPVSAGWFKSYPPQATNRVKTRR